MKKVIIIIMSLVLNFVNGFTTEADKNFTLSGYISDENGEDLIGATIYIKDINSGTVTNISGFYQITLARGKYEITYSYLGYLSQTAEVRIQKNTKINIRLQLNKNELNTIEVVADMRNANIEKVEMSTIKITMQTIKKIPVLMGEADIIKSIQLLPGVQTIGEGTSGFYVRGGAVDQNLILMDGANIYNPSHLGGFFSVFNSDAIKDVELYKGGIPAEYGGRLSSVLEINTKEGNLKELEVNGGIGTIASRLTIEGPLVKDKSSILLSARRTYADMFLAFSKDTNIQKSKLFFYDLNSKFTYIINEKNRIFVTAYIGNDVMKFANEFTTTYGNKMLAIRYNRYFNNKTSSNIAFNITNYSYNIGVPQGSTAFKWDSEIKDYTILNDYSWKINSKNKIKFGFQSTYHTFITGKGTQIAESFLNPRDLPVSHAIESSVFTSNNQKINDKVSLNYGIRYSIFQNIGEGTIYNFDEDFNSIDSTVYKKNKVFNTYSGFEPRIGIRYKINEKNSIKASYNRTSQYIHLATNSNASSPFDFWFVSNQNIKPQKADQVALGYFRNFDDDLYEASLEIYYKKMHNTIDFKDHAQLLLNPYFDGELRFGSANSYGLEFFILVLSPKA